MDWFLIYIIKSIYKGNSSLLVNSINITTATNKEEIIDFINNIYEKNDTGESISSELVVESSRRLPISWVADLSHHRAYRSVHGGSASCCLWILSWWLLNILDFYSRLPVYPQSFNLLRATVFYRNLSTLISHNPLPSTPSLGGD